MYPRSNGFSFLRYLVLIFVLSFFTNISLAGQLIYSTYLGGSYYERPQDITIDSLGNAYITGDTPSSDFPTTSGAFDTSYTGVPGSSRNVFVSKLDSSGSSLLYSTFLGGNYYDSPNAISIDSNSNVYICGSTYSTDFPKKNIIRARTQPPINPNTPILRLQV